MGRRRRTSAQKRSRSRSARVASGSTGDSADSAVVACVNRAWSCSRTCSGVYARRRRSARTTITPVATTPAAPANPTAFHHLIPLG